MHREDRIGHVGYAFLGLGQACIALGLWQGWPIRLVGEIIWVALGWRLGMSSIWAWGALGICVELIGWGLAT